jgi:hypothetical protein
MSGTGELLRTYSSASIAIQVTRACRPSGHINIVAQWQEKEKMWGIKTGP